MKKVLAVLAFAGLATTAMAQNTGVNLTDGDAFFRFGSTTTTVLFPTTATSSTRLSIDHFVNAGTSGTDLAFDMMWYAGVGTSRTRELTLTGYTSRSVSGSNSVTYTFANAFGISGLSATVTATLTDNAYGANTSRLYTSLVLVNNGAAPITDLDTFFSIDNDIGGSTGDIYLPLQVLGSDRVLVQRDAAVGTGGTNSALIGHGAVASGAGGFSALNTQLTDTGPDFTTLADLNSAGTVTTGDYAQFVQWRNTLGVGQQMSFEADVIGSIGSAVIPTPGSLALLGLGGFAAARRRRA